MDDTRLDTQPHSRFRLRPSRSGGQVPWHNHRCFTPTSRLTCRRAALGLRAEALAEAGKEGLVRNRSIRVFLPALVASAIFITSEFNVPLTAQTTTPQVIASGLSNPRGLAFGPGNALFVVEAGRGGTSTLCLPDPEGGPPKCYGPTGAVTMVSGIGIQQQVVTGLPSIANSTGNGATGPHDIDFGFGSAWITIGLGGDPALRAPFEANAILFGRLLRVEFNGTRTHPVDIGAFEATSNPDGGLPDTNPYGIKLLTDRAVVADAGGNALLQLSPTGVSTLAVFPTILTPNPMGGPDIPMQAVPTSVVEGPDGSLYVGQLTGFPFPVGGANVFRVPAGGGVPQPIADGFTNIIDIAVGEDGAAYVLELDVNGLLAPGTVGRLTKIGLFGSRTEIAAGALNAPGGITIGPDNAIYITTNSTSATNGQVVRIPQP